MLINKQKKITSIQEGIIRKCKPHSKASTAKLRSLEEILRGEGTAQWLECMFSMYKDLCSILSTSALKNE